MHRLVENDLELTSHVKLCNILQSAFRLMNQSWSFNLKSINRKERRTCGQKKNKISNSRGYFRPGRIWIRWRLKQMQMFSNRKIAIFVKSMSKCTALHLARYSTQKILYIRNFVRFRIFSSEGDIWINWLHEWNPCINNASKPWG